MKSELLNKACAAALNIYDAVGELCWQGDFGKGVSTGSGVFSEPGANPCLIYGPPPSAGVSSNGMVISGDFGAEFVFAKLTLGSTADLLPGQVYQLDKDYNAALLTTAASVLNAEAVVLNVWSPALAAGTYYGWFQRAGRVSVQAASGSVANGQGETTAVGGQLKFVSNTGHTAGAKTVSPSAAYQAASGITFTGATVNGSPYITAVATSGASAINDLQLGQVITGTGLPANSIIAAIDKSGGAWRITIGTNTSGSYNVLQNATANGTGVTFTVTSHVTVNWDWPTMAAQN
jgi:hypothetical protein